MVGATENGPEIVIINKAQAKKAPVTFPHEEHAEKFGCQTCHHTVKEGAKPVSCFECHGKNPDIPDPSMSSTKKNPFHIRCRGCHQEKGEGPTKCSECHKS
jgi:hypothetical protein